MRPQAFALVASGISSKHKFAATRVKRGSSVNGVSLGRSRSLNDVTRPKSGWLQTGSQLMFARNKSSIGSKN
jgi:hypothetical protein